MKSQSYSDGTSLLRNTGSIVHTRTIPVKTWNARKPMFRGKGATVIIQMEKTIQIVATHSNKILFEMFIFSSEDILSLMSRKRL